VRIVCHTGSPARAPMQMARSKKACLIFFDEVDAIGGARFDDGAGAPIRGLQCAAPPLRSRPSARPGQAVRGAQRCGTCSLRRGPRHKTGCQLADFAGSWGSWHSQRATAAQAHAALGRRPPRQRAPRAVDGAEGAAGGSRGQRAPRAADGGAARRRRQRGAADHAGDRQPAGRLRLARQHQGARAAPPPPVHLARGHARRSARGAFASRADVQASRLLALARCPSRPACQAAAHALRPSDDGA